MIDPRLKDRVAVVTGANHGIGAAAAQGLAAQGAKVVVTFLRNKHGASVSVDLPGREYYARQQARNGQEVADSIEEAGGKAVALELDLSAADAPAKLFDFAERHFGPVEILVNNAAYCEADTFDPGRGDATNPAGQVSLSFSAENFDRHVAVNLRAVGLLMNEFSKRHTARHADWGRIVNLSTDAADCFPTTVSYGATKFATESLTRSAAVELGKYGVTVNVISPGPIQTGYISPENEPAVRDMIPMGRLGEPADVADVIVFLASEQARWLSGQVLYVGGGKRM
jgi:3-oxoacyl-[acyl-carrier protein] reductase